MVKLHGDVFSVMCLAINHMTCTDKLYRELACTHECFTFMQSYMGIHRWDTLQEVLCFGSENG